MRRSILLPVLVALAIVGRTSGEAQGQQPQPQAQRVHTVSPGETLWDLARRYLSNPYLWPEIFALNRGVISDPHWIYPREQIVIPGLAGEAPMARDAMPAAPRAQGRTVFFGGTAEESRAVGSIVQATPADEAPVIQSGAFYAAGMLVPDSTVMPLGRLEEIISPTALPRREDPQIQPYDRVYMSLSAEVSPGSRVHLMRPDRIVAPYGRIFVSTGTALVLSIEAGTATVEIERMYDQVAVGDIALAMPAFTVRSDARPREAVGLEGVLLTFETPQPVASREDRAFVNLGRASGVSEGDEFVAYIPASTAEWGRRPALDVARVQVIRTGPLTSAVRVIAMEQPALEAGLPVRLVAKMP